MKVGFDKELVDMNDNVLKMQVPSGEKNLMGQDIIIDGPNMTLGRAAIEALLAQFQDETGITGEEKLKRFDLAMRVRNDACGDFPIDDISMIKKLIGKAYGPLVCGQAWKMLDGGV
jgi:hypothetical protein